MKNVKKDKRTPIDKDLYKKCKNKDDELLPKLTDELNSSKSYSHSKGNSKDECTRNSLNINCDRSMRNEHEERCLDELCKIDLCILGKKLILSGAMLEENLAVFLAAEAEKIDAAVDKFKKDHCDDVSIKDLMKINKSITDSICCLVDLEEKIVAKIQLGERLLKEKDLCGEHCKDHCHHKHDKDDDCGDDNDQK